MGYSINTRDYIDKMVNFCRTQGVNINLDNPTTIQDKLAWLNIYDENELKTKCADKIKIHDYCKEKLGKDICIPILKTYDSVDEINFDELPDRFVLKCNHGSGMNIIVKDKSKLDIEDAKMKLSVWMNDDFSMRNGFEAHYHDIERKIFVEEYKEDVSGGLVDYKILCFNGKPTYLQLFYGRYTSELHMNYYDMDFNIVDLARTDFKDGRDKKHERPKKLELMKEYAEKLSSGFRFVRVDFYEINGEIYLGELTFTPGAMIFKYTDRNKEKEVGKLLDISDLIPEKKITDNITATNSEKKILIYTGISGLYEMPTTNFERRKGYDYVLLSDVGMKAEPWESHKVSFENANSLNSTKKARFLKTHAHDLFSENDYDIAVWVDCNTYIDDKLYNYIEENKNNLITFKNHNYRECIYDEIMVCNAVKKENTDTCLNLYDRYSREGYPRHNGLYENNIIISHYKDERVKELMNKWWVEIFNFSQRDQLSLNYVIWKNGYDDFVKSVTTNDFPPRPHQKIRVVESTETKKKKNRKVKKKGTV